jgi:hypothetical protein
VLRGAITENEKAASTPLGWVGMLSAAVVAFQLHQDFPVEVCRQRIDIMG